VSLSEVPEKGKYVKKKEKPKARANPNLEGFYLLDWNSISKWGQSHNWSPVAKRG
jgi:hypothetical protein